MIPALTQNQKVGRGGDNCPRLDMMSSNAAGPKYMGVFEQWERTHCIQKRGRCPTPVVPATRPILSTGLFKIACKHNSKAFRMGT